MSDRGSRFRLVPAGALSAALLLGTCALVVPQSAPGQSPTSVETTSTVAADATSTSTVVAAPEQQSALPAPAEWLKTAPEVAKLFAGARGRSEEISVDQGASELLAMAGQDGSDNPIAAVASALLALFPAVDSPGVGSGATISTALAAATQASAAMPAARLIAEGTQDPLALATYGHALAIGLGTKADRVAGLEMIRRADEAAQPYAAMALYLLAAEGQADALERAAASGDLRARFDLVLKQLDNPATRADATEKAIAMAPRVSRSQHELLARKLRFDLEDRDGAAALYASLQARGGDYRSVLLELGADDIETSAIGDMAPELPKMEWIQGQPVTLESLLGKKVVVLEFWATWCGPCIASIPKLEALHRKHGDDVVVLAISDEDPGTIRDFLASRKDSMTYNILTDPQATLKNELFAGYGQTGIPASFVIGKDGKVSWVGHPMAGLDDQVETALGRDETPVNNGMALMQAVARHLRLISKPGRTEAARTALEPLRGADPELCSGLILQVVTAHLDGKAAEPDLEFVLGVLNSILEKSPDKYYFLRLKRGDLLEALGRYRDAIQAYTDSMKVLAKEHPQIEEIRTKIRNAETSLKEAAAAARPTPAPRTTRPGARGVRPDSSVNTPGRTSPRATPLVVAPRGTPLQVAPRGTPLVVAPRGTPIRVAPRGTPLSLTRQASDRATTISVENLN